MGWFGFGGSRSRDDRPRADARSIKNAADARSIKNAADARSIKNAADARSIKNAADVRQDARFIHEAVRIDRAGKPSRLPDDRPRRRDRDERWDRR
jgi:hypothetical protein